MLNAFKTLGEKMVSLWIQLKEIVVQEEEKNWAVVVGEEKRRGENLLWTENV